MWRWLVPLVTTAAVFTGVLLTTPPGFRAIADVLFGSPRGVSADAGAYALGAAASLALIALLVSTALCQALFLALRRIG